ncbi:MAG: DUF2332 family protein [Acidimicrobiales bacterium]
MSERPFDAASAYRRSFSPEDRARHPRYGALIDALSNSETARHLLGEAPPEQRNPMLVLAALHYAALEGDPVLAPLYERINLTSPDDFASTVRARLEAAPHLVRRQLGRTTQTNEPGRSAVLVGVLRELRARGVEDVHLIDVGTSLGLNLYPDYYRINDPDANDPAALEVEYLGACGSDGALACIHQRIGIDPNPLSPDVPDDVRWLEACLWPEAPERAARLYELVGRIRTWPPATRLAGSALERIDEALAACEPGPTPVIFHSWVAAYFSLDEQARWREKVLDHVSRGAIWIFLEHPEYVGGLTPPLDAVASPRRGGSQVVVARRNHGVSPWGWAHPHGRWIALSPPA